MTGTGSRRSPLPHASAAPAKVNFFLKILAKEQSGYHQIETLYCAVDFCDEIELQRTERGVSVEVVGPSVGPDEENLAYRAAEALLDARGVPTGVHISPQLSRDL